MLCLMAEAAGEPVSREKSLDVVWDCAAFPTTRTVDNRIATLRAKLEKNSDAPRPGSRPCMASATGCKLKATLRFAPGAWHG